MNENKNLKSTLCIGALILLLLLSLSVGCLSVTNAQTKENTVPFLSIRPNPIGVNQELLVNAWITPTPPLGPDGFSGIPRTGYTFTFTKPDGTKDVVTKTSSGEGATWFLYYPDQVGTWTVTFSWEGDSQFAACSTTTALVVQQEPIASWPAASLPTGYWSYPVNPENREWASIMGPWLEPQQGGGNGRGYDSTGSNFNPYSQGPNTAHILWTIEPPTGVLTGLIGGQYYTTYYSGSSSSYPISVVIAGRGYCNGPDGQIHCFNLTDGTQLWTAPGKFDIGNIEPGASMMGMGSATATPYLLQINNNFVKYDALTGAVVLNMTFIPGFPTGSMSFGGTASANVYLGFEAPYAYVRQEVQTGANSYEMFLIKLDTSGLGADLTQRIVYNVTFPSDVTSALNRQPDIGTTISNGILVYYQQNVYGSACGINTTDGSILWHKPINGPEQKAQNIVSYDGKFYMSIADTSINATNAYRAIDMATGNQVWLSDRTAYPWGEFFAYGAMVAYGNVYGGSYAGLYAFNATTGAINWEFTSGNSGSETPYGTWPLWSFGVVADGKIYVGTNEHSPTTYYRGQNLFCVDAYSGKQIWNIMGYWSESAIAEGKLYANNAYDGNTYCFSKGETSTAVTATNTGEWVGISGSVLDMSPAQPNTPCVSKDSMTGWMEYLHMQQPKPTNTTGVPVMLTATKSDGTSVTIGTATSDADGNFAFKWTPPSQDVYRITATFAGDDSYYSSYAVTTVSVGAQGSSSSSVSPSTSSSPSSSAAVSPSTVQSQAPASTGSSSTTMYIAIAAVVVIVAVVAAALVLRKRSK